MDFIHLKSPGNWINDPNGFIYYKGQYHMFYQHFPYEPWWGTMHWGHAVSDDLVHWKHKGIAIYPSKSFDQNGAFSGNALEQDGKLYIYYTGVKYTNPNPENIHITADYKLEPSQIMFVSEDGEHFDNFNNKRCLIGPAVDASVMSPTDTRDPKVWIHNHTFYMMLGSCEDHMGKLVFFSSKDGVDWKWESGYKSAEFGGIFECPDLFELDGKQVLFCAATDYLKDNLDYQAQEIYKFCTFQEKGCKLSWEKDSFYLDYGMDLYATQTNTDANGERVLFAWMRMPEPKKGANLSWSGLMTMPRVMLIKNGHLYFKPHKNVSDLFTITGAVEPSMNLQIINADYKIYKTEETEDVYMISANVYEDAEISINGYLITYKNGKIMTDRTNVYPKGNYRYFAETPVLQDGNHLSIFVDRDIIEIFANDGEYVLSQVVYFE